MVIDTLFGNLVKINPPSKFSLNQLWPTICRGALLLNCAGHGRRIRFGSCPLCLARFNTSGSVHDSSPSLKLPFLQFWLFWVSLDTWSSSSSFSSSVVSFAFWVFLRIQNSDRFLIITIQFPKVG